MKNPFKGIILLALYTWRFDEVQSKSALPFNRLEKLAYRIDRTTIELFINAISEIDML